MSRTLLFMPLLVTTIAAAAMLTIGTIPTFAHARYDRSEPPAGSMVDGTPFMLRAWFSQELMKASTIDVVDEAGNQVDLGDGRVDLDDPDRKLMLVSLPALPTGVYTVRWSTLSAEDGDWDSGTFTFGVGVMPPATGAQPAPAADGAGAL